MIKGHEGRTGENPGPSEVVRRFVSAQLLWGHHTAQQLGLTPSEFAVLNIIALERDVTPGELSRATGLSPAAVTRLADRLVERDFVVRTTDALDRRRVRIAATATWHEQIDAAVEPHRAAMRGILAGFTPTGRDAVMTWMAQSTPALLALLR